MKIKKVELETVCGITSKLPDNKRIEIAFIGRSNVGKSSLINSLLNRKSLARTSSQPGKTQTINYYNINDRFYLVDLPGYGYAKVSKEVKQKWEKMTMNYFNNSKMLRVVFLLVDIRHEPSALDADMYKKLTECGYNPLIILTKSDKLKKSQLAKNISVISKTLDMIPDTPLIPYSAVNGTGKDEVWEYIDEFLKYFEEEDIDLQND